jgi:hypothetical protein
MLTIVSSLIRVFVMTPSTPPGATLPNSIWPASRLADQVRQLDRGSAMAPLLPLMTRRFLLRTAASRRPDPLFCLASKAGASFSCFQFRSAARAAALPEQFG